MDCDVRTVSQPRMPGRGPEWRPKSKATSSYRKHLFLIHLNPSCGQVGVGWCQKSPWPLLIGYSLSQNLRRLLITQNQLQVHMVTQSGPFDLCNLNCLTSLACIFPATEAFLLAQKIPSTLVLQGLCTGYSSAIFPHFFQMSFKCHLLREAFPDCLP